MKICQLCFQHFCHYSKEQCILPHLLATFTERVLSSRFLWQPVDENVDEDSCSVCSHWKGQNKVGRPNTKTTMNFNSVWVLHHKERRLQCSTPQRMKTAVFYTTKNEDYSVLHHKERRLQCSTPQRTKTTVFYTTKNEDCSVLHHKERRLQSSTPQRTKTTVEVLGDSGLGDQSCST